MTIEIYYDTSQVVEQLYPYVYGYFSQHTYRYVLQFLYASGNSLSLQPAYSSVTRMPRIVQTCLMGGGLVSARSVNRYFTQNITARLFYGVACDLPTCIYTYYIKATHDIMNSLIARQ